MKNQISYRLGLDLGTNSIGWAMLALNENSEPIKIIDAGVRIFSDGRVPKTGEPLAVSRRIARGARRRRDRYLSRRKTLMNYLIQVGLMPQNELERKKLELLNPYELRKRALDEQLSSFELGRAIFHLNQRRGFKSNRKEITKEEVVEDSDEKKSKPKKESFKATDNDKRTNLEKAILENNCRTLGEYLFKYRLNMELTTRAKPDENALYPKREMYEEEFLKIKESQQKYQKITEENWQEIKEIIFHQRPLAPQYKGFCRFINRHKYDKKKLPEWAVDLLNKNKKKFPDGLPRAYLAMPSYQKFRILSEVNNLKIKDLKNRTEIDLTASQKQQIIAKLQEQKTFGFKKMRQEIGFKGDDFVFNFESDRRKGLDGNATKILLEDEKYFGKKWNDFSLDKQDEIVEFLFDKDEEEIAINALNDWNLKQDQANNLGKLTINQFGKTAVGNMCKEILQKLCQKIEEENCRYDEALKKLGIDHSDEEYANGEFDELSYYAEAIPASVVKVKSGSEEEKQFGKIANPTVHVALNQIRKVVNALIKENGKPAEIHIELARDLKISKDEKDQIKKQQNKNQKENEDAAKELESLGIKNNYDNRLKLKLWKELEKANNVALCPFSGKPISISNLFSSEIEIEHILPFSKTFDDSFANKTIAYKQANNVKGNKSPFEAFNNSPTGFNYEDIINRTKSLPRNKSWRFAPDAMKKFEDESGFISSQLNDTRYLSKISKQYLSQICERNKIRVANGKLTSILRHHWGLNSILEKLNYDPETGEVFENEESKLNQEGKKPVKKNRDDHRHHAIDAVCVAMTETSLLQKISKANSKQNDLEEMIIPSPNHWNRFREDVRDAIDKIVVSHRIDHGSNGKLHEETYYGILYKEENGCNVVYRKNLESLSDKEIENIRNEDLKTKIKNKKGDLNGFWIEDKAGNKKTPVKRVRIIKPESRFSEINNGQTVLQKDGSVKTIIHQKAVVGSNHHIAIWKLPENLKFLSALNLKGKKLEKFKEELKEEEKAKFVKFISQDQEILNQKLQQLEIFENRIKELKGWASKDYDYAVICISAFDAIKQDNDKKPHPAAKLLAKIHGGDLVKIKNEKQFIIAKVRSIKPSKGNELVELLEHNEAGNINERVKEKSVKIFYLKFSQFKTINLTKIYVDGIGKEKFHSEPILK